MILWNVSDKKIETMCGGQVFEFAPNEQKKIYNPDIFNHLIFKLKSKGLANFEEGSAPDVEKKALIDALKARFKTLDMVVRNFRTMNKELERAKLGTETPSEAVVNASEECTDLYNKIKSLEADKYAKVESYLNDDRAKEMAEKIAEDAPKVETHGVFETKVTGRRPGRPKSAAASA